ncbi:DUF1559 family PulG-like putative transporter [Frigoriglobus tundricola]|uniref:DUF1559 domain-containing protein n=1 Tax=Frigoriglobus tundricola TaxID=2774151 RepID=A0A6M5YT90_9BACT|nr:DUF1559 domain-containing protein [Frigoriglobus tundricola]QJW96491.1 hypothetical protein FTUN_4048 [Frigoriglobus tundricola]
MALRFPRTTSAVALALSLGLVGLPACKKKSKPTAPDTPAPETNAGPGTNAPAPAGVGGGDPEAPRPLNLGGPLEPAARTAALRNMKQIGFAIANFHDAHGALPAGYADATGQPGLSWRVALLPYIEQDALFGQFKRDEPWDGPNNKPLIAKMPKVYAPPNENTRGYTFCRGFTGPNTWLPPQQQPGRAGQLLLGVKTFQITGGLSNTILVAEAAEAVVWTKPDEVPFAPNSVPKLGGVFRSGCTVLMADGSVKFVRNPVSPAGLADAIQINSSKHAALDE